jgi:hypothetical protein
VHVLAERFFALAPDQRRTAHLYLASVALRRWVTYLAGGPDLEYVESVVGSQQAVDPRLPDDALRSATVGRDLAEVAKRYLEPITALQDDDWELPEDVGYAYYAIYNTFDKYALGERVDDWLVVNQALSSFGTTPEGLERASACLAQALAAAGG